MKLTALDSVCTTYLWWKHECHTLCYWLRHSSST